MTIQKVIANLDRTIANKKEYRNSIGDGAVMDIMRDVIDINIDELEKIRADLVNCLENN